MTYSNKAEPLSVVVSRECEDVTLVWKTISMGHTSLTPMDAIELARQLTYHAEQIIYKNREVCPDKSENKIECKCEGNPNEHKYCIGETVYEKLKSVHSCKYLVEIW